jgi:predicted nuclease with TOPRIM domain
MADERRTDLLSKLAELSEEAMHRLQEAPGGDRVVGAMNTMRDRLDELQKRVRGLDELEQRLTALEKKVDKLAKPAGSSTAKKST